MKIKMEDGQPDGILITVEEPFCADTYAEALQIIELLNMIKLKQVEQFKRSVVEMYAPKPPSPPAEMPEVDPTPMRMEAHQEEPIVLGRCLLFNRELDDKKAKSCIGCKVAGCEMKGRINPKVASQLPKERQGNGMSRSSLICHDNKCSDQSGDMGDVCMREEGPCEKQRTE